jgi:hypothetical protein
MIHNPLMMHQKEHVDGLSTSLSLKFQLSNTQRKHFRRRRGKVLELQALESPHTFAIRTTPFLVSGRTVVPSSFIFPARNSSNVSCISKTPDFVEVITWESD